MRFGRLTKKRVFRAFLRIVQVGVGCLFIYSSLPKIRQPYDFLSDVYRYQLVGPKLGLLVAMTLPWIELLVGICLVGSIFVGGALLACIGMAAMFTFVIGYALYWDLEISCGCFGTSGAVISYMTLARACIILLLSIIAYVGYVFLPTRTAQSSPHRDERTVYADPFAPSHEGSSTLA